ncbi:MAG: LTA synthase family protein [Bacteroidales bacterium]|nr:LTA synthase family protein [Bacteroidales bacterium]
MLKKYPIIALIVNILVVYILYSICRLLFVWCNAETYAEHINAAYLFRLMTAGLRFDTTAILYTNCWLILALLLPLHWKESSQTFHRTLQWIFTIVNSVAIWANLVDCAYFPFTGRRTTWSVLQEFGGEGANIGTIIWNEAKPYWYLFVVAALMTWALWHFFSRPQSVAKTRGALLRYYIVQTISLLACVALTIGGIRGGFTKAVRPITMSNANQYVDNAIDAGIVLNTPFCVFRSINKKAFVDCHYMDDAEAESLYSPLHIPADSAQFDAKNVVVLIMESFGGQAYKLGYMPFLDSLAHVGKSFQYSFSNGRKSIDGMPSVLSSIPSFVEPFFLTTAALNDISGLAGELTDHKGYNSAFFHGAENGSMGFQAFANTTGFQRYFGRTEYNEDPRYNGDADFDGTWAIWDEEFLQFFCDKISEMQQPFMTSVFTATSHPPFALPERYKERFPKTDPPLFGTILYSDNAIRQFFNKAKQQPWFENTIFVITADHASAIVEPEFKTDLGLYRVPIVIYSPSMPEVCGAGIDSTHIMSQIDIMPTLLTLLNYDRPYVAFGHDALHTDLADQYAVNYLPGNGWYQFIQGDWLIQFDGTQTVHAYRYKEDICLKNDLLGQEPALYVARLKSIIQQYMYRMNHNQLKSK